VNVRRTGASGPFDSRQPALGLRSFDSIQLLSRFACSLNMVLRPLNCCQGGLSLRLRRLRVGFGPDGRLRRSLWRYDQNLRSTAHDDWHRGSGMSVVSKIRRLAVIGVAGFTVSAAGSALAGTTTFTDSTFNSANYVESPVFTSNASLNYSFCPTCGQSGVPGLEVVLNSTGDAVNNGLGAIGFINTTFAYDPTTSGSIVSISASVNKILTDSIANAGAGNTFRPTIEQGGNYYLAAIAGPEVGCCGDPTTTGWNTLAATGLTAADFTEFDFATDSFGTANPDFSGGPMLFGLTQSFQNPGAFSATAIYDPLTITIDAVPEPSTWAMLLMGVGLVGGGLRESRRKAGVAHSPA
jgi:hypothetical protein